MPNFLKLVGTVAVFVKVPPISLDDYLNASKEYPYTWPKIPLMYQPNVVDLLLRVNLLITKIDMPVIVTSGYRSYEHNLKVGGAKDSANMIGKALDLEAAHAEQMPVLQEFLTSATDLLSEYGLWAESFESTSFHVHLTTVPKSERIFEP